MSSSPVPSTEMQVIHWTRALPPSFSYPSTCWISETTLGVWAMQEAAKLRRRRVNNTKWSVLLTDAVGSEERASVLGRLSGRASLAGLAIRGVLVFRKGARLAHSPASSLLTRPAHHWNQWNLDTYYVDGTYFNERLNSSFHSMDLQCDLINTQWNLIT